MQSSITHFKAWKKGKVWLYSASLITFLLLGAVTTQLAKADESTASPLTSLNSLTPNSLDASACSSNSETSEISTVSSVIAPQPLHQFFINLSIIGYADKSGFGFFYSSFEFIKYI